MIATSEMLASLEPGELLVKVVREGWTILPDHAAIAQANRALRCGDANPGAYRGRTPTDRQAECLAGPNMETHS